MSRLFPRIAPVVALVLSLALALAASLLPAPAHAYGVYGHQTIARIAMANVTPRTRAAVRALVSHAALLDTPPCATKTIEDLSVWPDCVRARVPAYAETGPWHYQDVDICHDFDLKPACKDGNCVSAQIDRNLALLKDRKLPMRDRVQALTFLVHFVGDLHMPLHAGEHDDQGANKVKAAYGIYAPDRLNLHSIWDTPLAERAITDGPSLVRRYPRALAARIAAGTTADWSRESWQISRDVVYPSAGDANVCVAPAKGRLKLDDATVASLVPVQRLQVERAGLRLARLLDEALGR